MAAPLPTWSTGAAGPLDKLLRETVASGDFPAVFMGVASADRILHWNQYGDRVYGDPGQGPVDENTSESLDEDKGIPLADVCSHRTLLSDEADHVHCRSAARGQGSRFAGQ
jgi:hypothetical protein